MGDAEESQTPAPKPQLPSVQDLAKLPRWARVAYAARSARRAQPLFTRTWPGAPKKHVDAVEQSIQIAESSTRIGRVDDITIARVAAHAVVRAAFSAPAGRVAAVVPFNVASIVVRAARNPAAARARAADAAVAADAAEIAPDDGSRTRMILAAERDFSMLRELAAMYRWTDDSPIDLDLLGPYWHDGEPDWWPEEELLPGDTPPVLSLEFALPVEMDEDRSADAIGRFIEGASELHRAMGGTGLRFHTPPVSFEPAAVQVPSGGGDDDSRWKVGGR